MTPIEELGDVFQKENVKLVNEILPEQNFNELFQFRNEDYDNSELYVRLEYIDFLRAVAQFPAFCGEFKKNAASNLENQTQACKRELATLFAHMTHESGDENYMADYEYSGLRHLRETHCTDCLYHYYWNNNVFEPIIFSFYKGRGPVHLRWNHMYARFSKAYFDTEYYGYIWLLVWPVGLLDDATMMFSSALWLYMTPHFPHPSAHNVMTGFFIANDSDLNHGAGNDFGTSILIMSQD